MKYRILGNSGLRVSTISLGSMFFGGAQYQATDNPVSKEDAQAVITRALETGINYLDCADIYGGYGTAEQIIGENLKDYDRDHIILSTKVMMPMSPQEFERGLSRKHVMRSIDRSLQNFGTDYVDLYYAHRYDHNISIAEIVRTMNILIDEGKIRHWATSNWAAAELERANFYAKTHGYEGPVVDQTKYHPFRRHPTEVSLPYTLDEYGMGLVSYKLMAEGMFAGAITSTAIDQLTEIEQKIINSELPRGYQLNQQILDRIIGFNELAHNLDITPAQLTYAWALRSPRVSTALMATRKPERVDENIGALDITLDSDTLTRFNELFPREYNEFDTYIRVRDNPDVNIIGRIPDNMMRF